MGQPYVIVLNGVGSVGKTSTARALQQVVRAALLHLSMDALLEMLPPRMFGHPDGLVFETVDEGGHPSVVIHSGPVMERLMAGMRRAVVAMAEEGNSLVVDDVMLGGREAEDYRRRLGGFDLYFVGLFAPLEVLEQRERARGDRALGLARWQYERVHQGVDDDLKIDTSHMTPDAAAETIRQRFGL
jgi:chloramphenicol 3-O phosphotransferase